MHFFCNTPFLIQSNGSAQNGQRVVIVQLTVAVHIAEDFLLFGEGFQLDGGAEDPLRTWEAVKEGMRRIRTMERDRILAENRKKYMK